MKIVALGDFLILISNMVWYERSESYIQGANIQGANIQMTILNDNEVVWDELVLPMIVTNNDNNLVAQNDYFYLHYLLSFLSET